MKKYRFVLLLLVALLCQSCLRTSVRTRYFVLSQQAVAVQELPAPVNLRRLSMPRYLKRWELLLLDVDGELHINDSALWGETLNEGLRRSLRHSLGSDMWPQPEEAQNAWQLDLDLRSFAGYLSGEFRVQADCRLERGTAEKRFNLEFSLPFKSDRPDSLVKAHEAALRQIAALVAAELRLFCPGE
ncbi:MAG: hypothetical protein GX901_05385 [Lentisphaerae bacterium]|nr:hypothetical protein [Lentisphaerota bacterium]